MSWTNALTETYDRYFNGAFPEDSHPLVPVAFIEKKIGIRVNIDRDASFHSANLLADAELICIPSDPAAESRTGQPIPYPLCDEIRYSAGDLSDHASENYTAYFNAYIGKLSRWCASDDAPEELKILFAYLQKRTLSSDIMACGAVAADKNNKFPVKYLRLFTDFCVYNDSEYKSLSEMNSVRNSWQKELLDTMTDKGLCYLSGDIEPIIENHAKIEGNAKLISAKDGPRPFQYKGRFTDADQACEVGYASSAKIHNTIRWLRDRQGFRNYGSTFITWSTTCRDIIKLENDVSDFFGESVTDIDRELINTEEVYAKRVNDALSGWRKAPEYKSDAKIIMLGMEAATPGRMSVNFYEEFDGSIYLGHLGKWYNSCLWRIPIYQGDVIKHIITTPSLRELGEAVFGIEKIYAADNDKKHEKAITKQIRRFNMDILTCIAVGKHIPENYANAAYHRSLFPFGFINKQGKWQHEAWLKCMAVTLAMLKSCKKKEDFRVALNETEKDRSYLFGRLLAVADVVEIVAVRGTDAQFRQTNAVRFFNAMQQRPATTWKTISERLQPYFGKFKYKEAENEYRELIDRIISIADDKVLSDNKALTPRFLEGYHNQRHILLEEFNKKLNKRNNKKTGE